MNKNLPAVFVLALLGLALAACGPQQQGAPSFGVWIDAPLDGSVLSPGVYQIIAHASSGLDITNLWISVSQWPNDSLVGTAIYGSNETTSINEGLAIYTGDWAFNVPVNTTLTYMQTLIIPILARVLLPARPFMLWPW